jgi:hypothetical protein
LKVLLFFITPFFINELFSYNITYNKMLTYLYSFNILESHHPDLLKYVFLLIATFISYSIIKYVLRLILYIKECIYELYLDKKMYRTNKKKGFLFECAVGMMYEKLGYTVIYNGVLKNKADMGIDLICFNKNKHEILFIQCKNYEKATIHSNIVNQFYGSSLSFFLRYMNYKATTIEDKHKSFINAMFNNTIKIKPILVCSKRIASDAYATAKNLGINLLVENSDVQELYQYHRTHKFAKLVKRNNDNIIKNEIYFSYNKDYFRSLSNIDKNLDFIMKVSNKYFIQDYFELENFLNSTFIKYISISYYKYWIYRWLKIKFTIEN